MPFEKGHRLAAKDAINREMWSQRLPVDVIEKIRGTADLLGLSQSDYVSMVVRRARNYQKDCPGAILDLGYYCCLDPGHEGPCWTNVKKVSFDPQITEWRLHFG